MSIDPRYRSVYVGSVGPLTLKKLENQAGGEFRRRGRNICCTDAVDGRNYLCLRGAQQAQLEEQGSVWNTHNRERRLQ